MLGLCTFCMELLNKRYLKPYNLLSGPHQHWQVFSEAATVIFNYLAFVHVYDKLYRYSPKGKGIQ